MRARIVEKPRGKARSRLCSDRRLAGRTFHEHNRRNGSRQRDHAFTFVNSGALRGVDDVTGALPAHASAPVGVHRTSCTRTTLVEPRTFIGAP